MNYGKLEGRDTLQFFTLCVTLFPLFMIFYVLPMDFEIPILVPQYVLNTKRISSRYRNYPPEQLVDLVARVLALVPPWTRVYRIQRDIPMPLVTSGVEKGNLRELALARMDDLGLKCRDVRTREAGIQVSLLSVHALAHQFKVVVTL